MISSDHLEPAYIDPFGRSLPPLPPIRNASHPISHIVAATQRNNQTKYLVAYQDLGPEYDEWLSSDMIPSYALQKWSEASLLPLPPVAIVVYRRRCHPNAQVDQDAIYA